MVISRRLMLDIELTMAKGIRTTILKFGEIRHSLIYDLSTRDQAALDM